MISFELSMPNVGSWNGKWSGEGNLYARTRSIKPKEREAEILAQKYFHYNFGDGWSAGITVRKVNAKEAAKIRKASRGFCGYDWMIDSIVRTGSITI
jgi:hypothetical protein